VLDVNNKLQGTIRVHYYTGLGIGTSPPINGAANLQVYNLYAGPTTGGPNINASGSTITIQPGGDTYTISGTTTVNTINQSWIGRLIKLRFSSAGCSVGNGTGNVKLARAFTSGVDDQLTLVYCGTSNGWHEVGRKATAPPNMGTVWNPSGQHVAAPTSQTATANTIYGLPVRVEDHTTLTGIRFRVGSTSTGNVQVALYDKTGANKLANSSSAAVATASTTQSVNFTGTVKVEPGIYWAMIQFSAAATFLGNGGAGYLGNGTNAAQGSFTLPASFTATGDTTQDGATIPCVQVY